LDLQGAFVFFVELRAGDGIVMIGGVGNVSAGAGWYHSTARPWLIIARHNTITKQARSTDQA
jgi:hypothetical protein